MTLGIQGDQNLVGHFFLRQTFFLKLFPKWFFLPSLMIYVANLRNEYLYKNKIVSKKYES